MPAPSPLKIATQAVQRLVKEDSYYQKELVQQADKVRKVEAELKKAGTGAGNDDADVDGNAEFMLKQERMAMEETRAMFLPLRERIADAARRLEEQLAVAEEEEQEGKTPPADEVAAARDALRAGLAVGTEPPAVATQG
ncbi:tubulin binding cofactor A [Xylariaceae sp. FL0804]|nr:tubulin binding cofactor A [Xylariaceae sp. FL0804]